ncbi:nucleotidyltransferase domain-containing protein [Polyangium mundeleinium]|uniref:nucleotidyltransferase domain-containing protein n=1 Tax=Polyangium mundeleinium TaxID=2995306 RepID=UPI00358DB5A5
MPDDVIILNDLTREEQIVELTKRIPGLTEAQAQVALDQGFSRESRVVFGGSRVRGDFKPTSDIDIGFGSLTERQAQRALKNIRKAGPLSPEERIQIVPGKSTDHIPTIRSPEEFFQRSGVRAPTDPRAGEPFLPSGSITATPDGQILIYRPGVPQ